jgi:tungstate transport system substrate-binding protein
MEDVHMARFVYTGLSQTVTCVMALYAFFLVPGGRAMSQTQLVRLEVVRVAEQSGLLADLLPDFEALSGYRVQVHSSTTDVFQRARSGEADLVISHYGFDEVERFVQGGFGFWPRLLFSNQAAILGPPDDPAQIRGLSDAVEAFRRIAKARAPFIANDLAVLTYLTDILWEGAGRPDRTGWYFDLGLSDQAAVLAASDRGAYTLWGVDPFVRFVAGHPLQEEMLCVGDPIFQRTMASVVVNPDAVKGVNVEGAQALERYLLLPTTQARIRAFRYEGYDPAFWWPAGPQN